MTKPNYFYKEEVWGFDQTMVTAAVRYCLNRRSYIVGCCVDWIVDQWDNFDDNTKVVLKRDVMDELERSDVMQEWKRADLLEKLNQIKSDDN
jgi:hypothetical protein